MQLTFTKMHGLGNDFVVIDASKIPFTLTEKQISKLGNRHTGVGFDQLLVIEKPSNNAVDFDYRIFNCDGSEVEHCGNGARCFAKYVFDKKLTAKKHLKVKVKKGIIVIDIIEDNLVKVQMGKPIVLPSAVPFIVTNDKFAKSYSVEIDNETLDICVLSMGNPHAVILLDKNIAIWQYAIEPIAKQLQQHSRFPQSVNVSFAQVVNNNEVNLRVYERGAGETQACGTGACATAFALHQLGKVSNLVNVNLLGGKLQIEIIDDIVYMTGLAETVFEGQIEI